MQDIKTNTPTAEATSKAYLLLSVTAFCWGCNTIFAKLAVGQVSPMLLVSLRWLGAVLLLLIFANKILLRDWHKLRGHFGSLFWMGSLGLGAFSALFYIAAYTTSALNIGIIQGAVPVFVLMGDPCYLPHERIWITTNGGGIDCHRGIGDC